MRRFRFVMTLFCVSGCFYIDNSAAQTTYYVDQSRGNDGQAGTDWASAKATINAALILATGSDTVCVAEGNYQELIILPTNVVLLGGFPSGGGLRNLQAHKTIIDGQRQGTVVMTYGNSSALIDGFTITGGRAQQGGGIYGMGNCVFRHLQVTGNHADGMGGGFFCSQNVTIEDCQITNNTALLAPAIAIIGGRADYTVVVRRNVIQHNKASSLQLSGGAINVTSLLRLDFSFNLVADNIAHDGGVYFVNAIGEKTLDHNTIARNGGYGLSIENSSGVILSNSIVYHHRGADVIVEDVFSNPRLRYSDIGTVSGVHLAENLLSVDPQFADTAAGNYTLQSTSPCIDAGDPDARRDADGSITDLGAFPYLQQPVAVETIGAELPTGFSLEPVFPNPSRGNTNIIFSLTQAAPVRVAVYDVLGREIRELVATQLSADRHLQIWDGRDAEGRAVAAGIYFISLSSGFARQTRSLVLSK